MLGRHLALNRFHLPKDQRNTKSATRYQQQTVLLEPDPCQHFFIRPMERRAPLGTVPMFPLQVVVLDDGRDQGNQRKKLLCWDACITLAACHFGLLEFFGARLNHFKQVKPPCPCEEHVADHAQGPKVRFQGVGVPEDLKRGCRVKGSLTPMLFWGHHHCYMLSLLHAFFGWLGKGWIT